MRYKLTYSEDLKHLHILKENDDQADYMEISDWEPVEVLDEFKHQMNTFYRGLEVCSPDVVPTVEEIKMRWNEFKSQKAKEE